MMKRSREESQGDNNNKFVDQAPYPCLNLPLTKSPELIHLIETYLKEHYPCPPQQTESSKTSNPPKSLEKLKAMNFPVAMITIGKWTYCATNPDDIVAKFYFAKKKLIWEFLSPGELEANMPRLKRKIEIQWDDVSSFQESINSRDETGILKIELRKRPTFFIETNPQAGKHTQWKQMDQDFTGDQASTCRRQTLHFHHGVLQKNLEKLMSDSFWSKLYKVRFPLQEAIYFDIDYRSQNNTTNNSSRYIPSQTPRFNVNNGLQHHYSQGIGGVGVGEGNFNMAPQVWANDGWQNSYSQVNSGNNDGWQNSYSQVNSGNNDGWQNSYSQVNSGNNTPNELFGTQAIPPLFQVINEHYNMQRYFTDSRYSNLMIQDESEEMQNTTEILLGGQAYALPETQTNLMMPPHMNDIQMYPPVGPYLAGTLLQEEERQYN